MVALFVASYALSGLGVLKKAAEGMVSKGVFNENFLLTAVILGNSRFRSTRRRPASCCSTE